MDQILASVRAKGTFINPSNVSLYFNYSVFPYSYGKSRLYACFFFFYFSLEGSKPSMLNSYKGLKSPGNGSHSPDPPPVFSPSGHLDSHRDLPFPCITTDKLLA